jgi:voltage-gated potassium channel
MKLRRRQKWLLTSLILIGTVPIIGTIGFFFLEPTVNTVWDAFYFTIITIFTVGYGDVYPTTMESQALAIFVVVLGFTALITSLQSIFNHVISQDLREELGLPSRRTRMKNHIILCGFGNLGQQIFELLKAKGEKYVVVERDSARVAVLVDSGVQVISGEATDPDTLQRANINEAKAMVLTMHDPTNIMVAIAAKRVNPNIYIVSEVEDMRNLEVLRKLGADEIVHCFEMGARVMVSKARRTIMDPVCGAEITPSTAKFTWDYEGKKYYFDSKECMDAFEKNPARFVEMVGLTDTCRVP